MDEGPGAFAGDLSPPGRLAGPGEGISPEELALAARNHGLPLEALRHDLTPLGLHYVLVHYDIPYVPDASSERWQLTVHGRVRRPLALDVAALRSFPAVTLRVTMECAGNGRALLAPRPVSQPWLVEAVGTAEWTGVPLRLLLAEAGIEPDAVEVVFSGADHGVERGVEQDYRRSLPLDVATGDDSEVLVAYRMNGGPLPPQHGHPLRLVVPGWYGMAHVKWLREIRLTDTPFTGFQQATAYRYRQEPGDPGQARHPNGPTGADDPAWLPGLHVQDPFRTPRPRSAGRKGLVGVAAGHPGRGDHGRLPLLVRRRTRPAGQERGAPLGLATVAVVLDGHAGEPRPRRPRHRCGGPGPAAHPAVEPRRLR